MLFTTCNVIHSVKPTMLSDVILFKLLKVTIAFFPFDFKQFNIKLLNLAIQ